MEVLVHFPLRIGLGLWSIEGGHRAGADCGLHCWVVRAHVRYAKPSKPVKPQRMKTSFCKPVRSLGPNPGTFGVCGRHIYAATGRSGPLAGQERADGSGKGRHGMARAGHLQALPNIQN